MGNLIEFIKVFTTGFRKVNALARQLKIAPDKIKKIENHTTFNSAAFSMIAVLTIISIYFFSPSNPIGLTQAIVASFISIAFLGLVGFFINMAERRDAGNAEESALATSNKWASVLAIDFIILQLIFIATNLLSIEIDVEKRDIVTHIANYGVQYELAQLITVVALCATSTALLFYGINKGGRIVDSRKKATQVFVIITIVNSLLFMCVTFLMF